MKTFKKTLHNQNGATIVFVAVVLGLLVMFTALAIDVNHLYAVRNELQNAADAGALAGASVLFDGDGSLNREAARDEGLRVTVANGTGNQLVDIVLDNVQTGHWSFSNKTFTPSDATVQAAWQERSFADLDIDPAFINAVRVQADRDDTPSFFAGIFGYQDFFVAADAVAYIGFAGTIYPNEIDRPIAICEDAIKKDGAYNCNMGRMLNSGGNANTSMTAMWTNYSQDPCATASNSDMQGLTKDCAAGNPDPLNFGEGMGTQNGVQDNVLGNVADCWTAGADSDGDGNPDSFWPLVLPVIDCNESNTCAPLVGAVEVNVVWIQYKNDPQMNDIPTVMEDWNCTPATSELADRLTCWKSFVDHFNLENVTGPPATDADYEEMYQQKNLYFLPSCEVHEPIGNTGGENFGILAKIPKLVE